MQYSLIPSPIYNSDTSLSSIETSDRFNLEAAIALYDHLLGLRLMQNDLRQLDPRYLLQFIHCHFSVCLAYRLGHQPEN